VKSEGPVSKDCENCITNLEESKMKHFKIYLTIFTMILVGVACGTKNGIPNNTSSGSTGDADSTLTPTITATLSSPTNTPVAVEESGDADELPPLSFVEILDAGIESGDWSEGEGLVQILKYFVGQTGEENIPEIADVTERTGTGIVRLAGEFINSPDGDPLIKNVLEHLLRIIFPPQEILDAISKKRGFASTAKLASIRLHPTYQNQATCQNLADLGYEGNLEPGINCFFYTEQIFDGNVFRVYYPDWWAGDDWPYIGCIGRFCNFIFNF
jgi:hypothetical protein